MILFIGCSFTWGAGLQFEYLIEHEDWTPEQCNELVPPKSYMEYLNYKSDMFRKEHHYPNLVAKHFDKHYALGKLGNGGDNSSINFLLDHLGYFMVTDKGPRLSGLNPIKLVVIQFTDWTRLGDIPMETQVDQVIHALENDNHRWIAISWLDDIAQYIKKIRPYNFCQIEYDGVKYDNFEKIIHSPYGYNDVWVNENKLTLEGKYGNKLQDEHFCAKGHRVLAKSIIKKVEENNIF